jgi:hypothetical protein
MRVTALKRKLIYKWEKEIEKMKLNARIVNIPRFTTYHISEKIKVKIKSSIQFYQDTEIWKKKGPFTCHNLSENEAKQLEDLNFLKEERPGATILSSIQEVELKDIILINNINNQKILEKSIKEGNDDMKFTALKRNLIYKWEKEIENMKFNAPIENIPRLTSYHRRVIKRGLRKVWKELKQDIDRSVNLVIVNLRNNDDEDKKFVNVFAEYLTIKLQSHIINNLKVHQSKKNSASQKCKKISVDRISYRYKLDFSNKVKMMMKI